MRMLAMRPESLTVQMPPDIQKAFVESIKSYLLQKFAGGDCRLEEFSDQYASLTTICSFNIPGSRRKNLARLVDLAKSGVLIERPRYGGGTGARSFRPASQETLMAIGAQAIREWEEVGYIIGKKMPRINSGE